VSSAIVFSIILSAMILTVIWPFACSSQPLPREKENVHLRLMQAFLCEEVREGIPFNQAVVFSLSRGTICCYTMFDEIEEDTFIYHQWLYRDRASAKFRLSLKAPRWATFSSIQLREGDKGPWQVEITDSGGRILKTLRFSVVD
jgi:hypothetical protein